MTTPILEQAGYTDSPVEAAPGAGFKKIDEVEILATPAHRRIHFLASSPTHSTQGEWRASDDQPVPTPEAIAGIEQRLIGVLRK